MSERIEDRLKAKARDLGFELAGIARAGEADGFDRFRDWLDRGYAGEMNYLHRHAEPRRHPRSILDDVRSVLMLGMTYGDPALLPLSPLRGEVIAQKGGCRERPPWRSESLAPPDAVIPPGEASAAERHGGRPLQGTDGGTEGNHGRPARIAKYALGPDYHRFLWDKLNLLSAWLEAAAPGGRAHGVADSAPLLERDFARRAGLGWVGKNTMLLNKECGSFFLLSALLTTLELEPDPAFEGGHCGTCTACLDACPTQAFPQPGVLDARRCVSYLTIELKTSIPESLRPGVGDWLFGCDICQDVCPWNHRPNPAPGLPIRPDLLAIDPVELLGLSPEELRRRFRGTSLRRANWRGLLRNAAIVLGNRGDVRALPTLRAALKWPDEVVREACEWAIRRIEGARSASEEYARPSLSLRALP
ncbi:MAG TPA: tRNA epoxyqueuosine(34) reductase QueG [Gemmataceae bacterium]|nr:tRNA epoxyqueuosine(34) reductase QueG [Gemmataceae bacterium]